jgi:hypothetical protein
MGGALDIEQSADAVKRLLGQWRSGEVHVMEFAPHMRPAKYLGDIGGRTAAGLVQRAEAGEAVGVQEAAEPGQVPARMLAFAVG